MNSGTSPLPTSSLPTTPCSLLACSLWLHNCFLHVCFLERAQIIWHCGTSEIIHWGNKKSPTKLTIGDGRGPPCKICTPDLQSICTFYFKGLGCKQAPATAHILKYVSPGASGSPLPSLKIKRIVSYLAKKERISVLPSLPLLFVLWKMPSVLILYSFFL